MCCKFLADSLHEAKFALTARLLCVHMAELMWTPPLLSLP